MQQKQYYLEPQLHNNTAQIIIHNVPKMLLL